MVTTHLNLIFNSGCQNNRLDVPFSLYIFQGSGPVKLAQDNKWLQKDVTVHPRTERTVAKRVRLKRHSLDLDSWTDLPHHNTLFPIPLRRIGEF